MKHVKQQQGVYCLNRGWRFLEQDISVLPATRNHDDVYGYSKAGAAKGPAGAGFDDSSWEQVELPHDWVPRKAFTPDASPNMGYKERGIGWYRLRFGLDEEDREKQILLEFEGMSCDAAIYVNGQILKRSHSGYNSFCVDMTDIAHFGVIPNTLAVRIDASAWEGWWYEGAGIYRNVWLVKKNAIHIGYNGVWAKPEKTGERTWNIAVETVIENSFEFAETAELTHVLMDDAGLELIGTSVATCVDGFQCKTVTAVIQVNDPELWSPETPVCYQIRTSIRQNGEELDYVMTPVGFRTIRLDAESGFHLNGRAVKLKGFCNHQDHAGVGVAVPYAIKQYRVRKLKALGANAYRCAHNPDPEILEICDREGLMVMEENRTYSTAEENLAGLRGIVKTARNHPSVILYSVFNEEPLQGTGKGRRMAGRLQAEVKALDDTRPVLGAFNGGYMEMEGAATILEAVGINYNPGRYDDFHKKFPEVPLIGSETASAFMVRGEYQTDLDKHVIAGYDEDCALWGNTIRQMWRSVAGRPFVAGTFVWTGFDYKGEPTPFEWPSVGTFFGTYDSCGFEKDAVYFYKAFWKEEAMVHLVSPWRSKQTEGTLVKVMVISNCDEVELRVNGHSIAKKECDPIEQTMFEIPYETGELMAVGYRGGKAVARDVQRTAGAAAMLLAESSKCELESGGYDAAAVDYLLVDADGNPVMDQDVRIELDVRNGRILGVGNGDPNSHESETGAYVKTFHGRAQVILKAITDQPVQLRACVSGLSVTEIVIPVRLQDSIPYVTHVQEKLLDNWRMYHKLFDEKPESNPKVSKNDMNSFEPVEFSGQPQPELTDQLGKYGLYRVELGTAGLNAGTYLYFGEVLGHVWIYLNGELMFERTDKFAGDAAVHLPDDLPEELVVTVIVQNSNHEWAYAGICAPVKICCDK